MTCNLGTMASGGSATISLVITLPSTPGPVSNTASVTTSNPDTNAADSAQEVIGSIPFSSTTSPFQHLAQPSGVAAAGRQL
ncbi:MAG: hypothetical protein AABO58_04825 [Acidobacteriota bacterium]